jgi:hypothetical protein
VSAAAKKVERANKQLAKALAELADERRRRTIKCGSCPDSHAIGDLHLLVTHFYIEPHGCTGGDYWKEGEWQFVCPATKAINRIMFNDFDQDWKERDTIRVAAEPTFKWIYRSLFKSHEDVHRHESVGRSEMKWCNNYDVDRRRADFELPPKKVKP